MPKPVISPIMSVFGFLQWQEFERHFSATNTPTSWSCTPLAPGLWFDNVLGVIVGAAERPGIYEFYLTATNAAGDSDPVLFVLSIQPTTNLPPSNILDVRIDVITKVVTINGKVSADAEKGDGPPSSILWVKAGDDLTLNITFENGGVIVPVVVTQLKFAVKEFTTEARLVAGGTWLQNGTGPTTSYRLAVSVDSPALRAALTSPTYLGDYFDQFVGLAEIEWVATNTYTPKVGPDTLRSTSRTFGITLPLDLIPN